MRIQYTRRNNMETTKIRLSKNFSEPQYHNELTQAQRLIESYNREHGTEYYIAHP